jgi:hypothetical protein
MSNPSENEGVLKPNARDVPARVAGAAEGHEGRRRATKEYLAELPS